MEYLLETNNLVKEYKDVKVLNNLNIHVKKGAIYGLIGKNGAGKTTLIRLICGLQKPSKGTYSIYGVKNTNNKITNVRKRIGAIIEVPSIRQELSAKENLIEQDMVVGILDFSNVDYLLKLVGLENVKERKVKNFSLGMKQRLAIAMALIRKSRFFNIR